MVVGVIRDERGDPVVGARVSIGGSRRLRTSSVNGGHYHIRAVPLEVLELLVHAAGFETARLSLGVGSPGQRQVVDVRLERASAVAGVVLDPDGRPVAGARVVCIDHPDAPNVPRQALSATSDGQGRFAMSADAAGCAAVARHERFGDSAQSQLASGDRNQLRLGRGGRIDGEVVDERGRPIRRYRVAIDTFRAARSSGGRRPSRGIEIDDPSGRFVLEGLTAGRYVLAASAPGRPPAHSESIEVEDNGRQRVRIELLEGGTVTGQVRDADTKEPIAGAVVALDMAAMSRGYSRPARSGQDGAFELSGVPRRGMFSLSVAARGYNRKILSSLSLEGRKTHSRDAELTPKSRVNRSVEYSGIGASIRAAKDGIALGKIFPGGPAEQAGLESGDVMLRIDGRDASQLSVVRAIQLLRGPDGS